MKKIKLSKSVENGSLVRKCGQYFIPCSGNKKPFGVVQLGRTFTQKVLKLNGTVEKIEISLPNGIVIYGDVEILFINNALFSPISPNKFALNTYNFDCAIPHINKKS